MARIVLGMGSSHTPMLNAPPTDWPRFIERDSRRTNLLDIAGRLTSYDEQLKHAPSGIAAEIAPERMATRHATVDSRLARHLIDALIEREFDIAASDGVPDGEGEGHAIGFVHKRIMQEVVPIVPVCINTYYPPNQPTPKRCYRLGQAIRAAVESYPGDARVGIIASGGLSHFVVDEALDRGLFDLFRRKDAAAIEGLPREKLNSGSSEIRNWICVAGAVEHLALEWSLYEPGYRTPAGTGTGLGFAFWS